MWTSGLTSQKNIFTWRNQWCNVLSALKNIQSLPGWKRHLGTPPSSLAYNDFGGLVHLEWMNESVYIQEENAPSGEIRVVLAFIMCLLPHAHDSFHKFSWDCTLNCRSPSVWLFIRAQQRAYAYMRVYTIALFPPFPTETLRAMRHRGMEESSFPGGWLLSPSLGGLKTSSLENEALCICVSTG